MYVGIGYYVCCVVIIWHLSLRLSKHRTRCKGSRPTRDMFSDGAWRLELGYM